MSGAFWQGRHAMNQHLKSILCDLSNAGSVGVWNKSQSKYFGGKLEMDGDKIQIEAEDGAKIYFNSSEIVRINSHFEIVLEHETLMIDATPWMEEK